MVSAVMFNYKKLFGLLVLLLVLAPAVLLHGHAKADVSPVSPYSWDQGLYATSARYNDSVHAWGGRKTGGAWGTGPVNYQSGSTTNYNGASSGTMSVRLNATYCPGGNCSYGSGSGYKGLVQFWNDQGNYIAFGLIHDPGVSPTGTTLMIEGASNGRPVGGYWPANGVSGTSHQFTFHWTASGISVTVDNNVTLGPYPVSESHPSISFLAAGRNTGDVCDTTFTNINFSDGSITAAPVTIPSGNPYATYTATLNENGSGSGYSSYINMHDAHNNALSVGIQTDSSAPETSGTPNYTWERVQNGQFTYNYLGAAASGSDTPVTLKWWRGDSTAVFYIGSTPVADIDLAMTPRLFFSAEGNARKNGDSVNSAVKNVQVSIGDSCPTYCGLNGAWNTSDSSFHTYGLQATNTNGQSQNGANFTISGTVNGLPANGDWDSYQVSGVAMIAQYWNGQ